MTYQLNHINMILLVCNLLPQLYPDQHFIDIEQKKNGPHE